MSDFSQATAYQKSLDFIGGCVDRVFLTPPRVARVFKKTREITLSDYERQVNFYVENGFTENPSGFFTLPEEAPEFRIIEEKPYKDGRFQVLAYESGYRVKNPLLEDRYQSFERNRTGYIVRWIHPRLTGKTLICLHGYMLGEPEQAHRMFHVDKLYGMGLDVALYITPFHWRRAPESPLQRGIFLQTDDVAMTCECMGQSMYDLHSVYLILEKMGAGDIGLIGASLGGYNASLYSCLSDRHAFAAMMVPAVNFTKPYGPSFAKLPFDVPPEFMEKIVKVWELHSPLSHTPKLSVNKMLFVASRGDLLCPFEYLTELQKKWRFPRYGVMTGGHWLVFNEEVRGRSWYTFLADMGFIEKK
jgi:hypothetical protein